MQTAAKDFISVSHLWMCHDSASWISRQDHQWGAKGSPSYKHPRTQFIVIYLYLICERSDWHWVRDRVIEELLLIFNHSSTHAHVHIQRFGENMQKVLKHVLIIKRYCIKLSVNMCKTLYLVSNVQITLDCGCIFCYLCTLITCACFRLWWMPWCMPSPPSSTCSWSASSFGSSSGVSHLPLVVTHSGHWAHTVVSVVSLQ